MTEYKIRLSGDDYWNAFQLCRIRLAYLWRLRTTVQEPWSQQDLESFLLHARLLLEQIALFFREAAVDRSPMSRARLNSYQPDRIMHPYKDVLQKVRFVTFEKLDFAPQSDGVEINMQYGPIIRPDINTMTSLYGRTNNFLHVTAKLPTEALAHQVMKDFFAFFTDISPLFDRHAVERPIGASDAPPNPNAFEIVVGRQDRLGQDEFWECKVGAWTSRLVKLADRTAN